MYHSITKGKEYSFFDEKTIAIIHSNIRQELLNFLDDEKNWKPIAIGAFIMENLTLLSGEKINAWIEYRANIHPLGLIDVGVAEILIFDDVPDIILDRYNEIKKVKSNIENIN